MIIIEYKLKCNNCSEDEQSNQEWYTEKSYKTMRIKSAQKLVRKLSLRTSIYEALLTGYKNDYDPDPTIQEFYRNGKLEDKIF